MHKKKPHPKGCGFIKHYSIVVLSLYFSSNASLDIVINVIKSFNHQKKPITTKHERK